VGVLGLHLRGTPTNLTPIAQMPQNPTAEPAGWLAQLCLLGLGFVLVAKPNSSWVASPLSSHAAPVYGQQREPLLPAAAGSLKEPRKGSVALVEEVLDLRIVAGPVREIDGRFVPLRCILVGELVRVCRYVLRERLIDRERGTGEGFVGPRALKARAGLG